MEMMAGPPLFLEGRGRPKQVEKVKSIKLRKPERVAARHCHICAGVLKRRKQRIPDPGGLSSQRRNLRFATCLNEECEGTRESGDDRRCAFCGAAPIMFNAMECRFVCIDPIECFKRQGEILKARKRMEMTLMH